MRIELTRFLEVGSSNAEYDLEEKPCKGCTSADWSNEGEIKEVIAADNNKDNDDENPQDKNR